MPSWLRASAPAAITMTPFNPPLGVYPEMARAEPTLLAIKEGVMSLSGDDFSVKDQNGHTVVKCKGKAMSMRERKSESLASSRRLRDILSRAMVEAITRRPWCLPTQHRGTCAGSEACRLHAS